MPELFRALNRRNHSDLLTLLKHKGKCRHQDDSQSKYKVNHAEKLKIGRTHVHQLISISNIGPMQGKQLIDDEGQFHPAEKQGHSTDKHQQDKLYNGNRKGRIQKII